MVNRIEFKLKVNRIRLKINLNLNLEGEKSQFIRLINLFFSLSYIVNKCVAKLELVVL